MMLIRTTKTIGEIQHPENVAGVTHYNNRPPIFIYQEPIPHNDVTNRFPWAKTGLVMGMAAGIVITAMLLVFFAAIVRGDNLAPVELQKAKLQQEQEQLELQKAKLQQEQERFELHKAKLQQEQELQRLFEQTLIDPLTDAINEHEGDSTRVWYVQRLKTERAKRCSEIERRFQRRSKNRNTLAILAKGYNYSCPDVITRFAQYM